jgi:hypothetical protein
VAAEVAHKVAVLILADYQEYLVAQVVEVPQHLVLVLEQAQELQTKVLLVV